MMRSWCFITAIFLSSTLSAGAFICISCVNQYQNDASPSRCYATSLPDINYGLSDKEFHTWLQEQVQDAPGRNTYASTYEESLTAIVNWRKRYRGNPQVWKRIFKKDRVVKELIESAPVIEFVKRAMDNQDNDDDEKFTIIDLCSGKGYLSMFLSEIQIMMRSATFDDTGGIKTQGFPGTMEVNMVFSDDVNLSCPANFVHGAGTYQRDDPYTTVPFYSQSLAKHCAGDS